MEKNALPIIENKLQEMAIDGVERARPTGLDLYNRGMPLWTRELLKNAQEQIDKNEPGFYLYFINVVFFGYRHLLNPTYQDMAVRNNERLLLPYATYTIRQFYVNDDEYPYLYPRYNLDTLDREFKTSLEDWRTHEARGKLVIPLLGMERMPDVNKIICFGLGNHLIRGLEYWTQHPAAISIRNCLRAKLGHDIRLLTHDTQYTWDTKHVLERHGFEVIGLNGVDGFVEVDENSLVFATSSDIPVNKVLAELARPAVIITRAFKESDLDWVFTGDTTSNLLVGGRHDRFDPDTPRTKAMFADYTGYRLWEASGLTGPKLWTPWLTTEMTIYVRNEDYKGKEGKKDEEGKRDEEVEKDEEVKKDDAK
ncbi:hypothetical protein F4859DRAFT_513403 [Xylaria cf. heliscus]|nr:hypothetical protein F4859DRAFT_513403 [Xylaria cf. heliscus]